MEGKVFEQAERSERIDWRQAMQAPATYKRSAEAQTRIDLKRAWRRRNSLGAPTVRRICNRSVQSDEGGIHAPERRACSRLRLLTRRRQSM